MLIDCSQRLTVGIVRLWQHQQDPKHLYLWKAELTPITFARLKRPSPDSSGSENTVGKSTTAAVVHRPGWGTSAVPNTVSILSEKITLSDLQFTRRRLAGQFAPSSHCLSRLQVTVYKGETDPLAGRQTAESLRFERNLGKSAASTGRFASLCVSAT